MALSIGIVGLTNVGKSTLFNALTKAQNAEAGNYPFSTLKPNKATAPMPDQRLDGLTALVNPRKVTQATVDFTDISGLVRGASKGEGLGNQFLGAIRECTAILEVVRCFEDENIPHVDGPINPARDMATIETELLLADMESVEKRLDRVKKVRGDKSMASLAVELQNLLDSLGQEIPAKTFLLEHGEKSSDAFKQTCKELGLLSAKKVIYCANVGEEALAAGEDDPHVSMMCEEAAKRGADSVVICAKIEEELRDLPDEEQAELLSSFGITESGLAQVIRTGYRALSLASFFTAGKKEVRAWTIPVGCKAPQAAGVIHSDLERGFIRAEVITYDDYVRLGSEAAARSAGVLRVEGKEYVVKDGDVVHFLFNV